MLTDTELAHARQVATETMTGRLTATGEATEGGWDPVNGPTDPVPGATLYDGPGRIQAVRQARGAPTDAAGQPVTVRAYKVALPWDTPDLPVGQRLTVHAYPPDPGVVRKVLTVTGIVYGDLGVERVLYCDLDLTNQPAGVRDG